MPESTDPHRLPHEKGFHISWDQIHRDSRALAWRLDGMGPDDGAWRAVVAITRGGMAPAMIAARELDIRTVDTISIKSYDHQSQSDAHVLQAPDAALMGDGTGILIIDDLVEGQIPNTMEVRGLSREQVINDVLLAPQPTKEFVQIEQIAALAIFLCKDEARSITGANISIDGGWTAQ